jgi:hypothetical protein
MQNEMTFRKGQTFEPVPKLRDVVGWEVFTPVDNAVLNGMHSTFSRPRSLSMRIAPSSFSRIGTAWSGASASIGVLMRLVMPQFVKLDLVRDVKLSKSSPSPWVTLRCVRCNEAQVNGIRNEKAEATPASDL